MDVGDFIGAHGGMKKMDRGEVSVVVRSLQMLTKSLRSLPDKVAGLTDIQKRYRQRWDRCSNPPPPPQQMYTSPRSHADYTPATSNGWPAWGAPSHADPTTLSVFSDACSAAGASMACRYLDMIVTEGVIETFQARAKVNAAIRTILTDKVGTTPSPALPLATMLVVNFT